MSIKKVVALLVVFTLAAFLLTGCSSQTLGYRKYPHVRIDPSLYGELITLRLPLDEHEYIYDGYHCEYTTEGIDLIIRFTQRN